MDRRQLIGGGAAISALTAMSACASEVKRLVFDGDAFTVCRYDPRVSTLRLALTGADGKPLRSLARLAAQPGLGQVRFAMNAGMFDTDGRPIGLYAENGVVRHALNTGDGKGNFYLKPGGVFFVAADGAPGIETTSAFALRSTLPPWATQSGPMLVIDGSLHPAIAADGASKYIRNAVGVTGDQAVFVISETPVSFGKLARCLRDGLGCQQALYLDGYVSSLWLPSRGRRDARAELGPMVVVSAR